MADEAKRRLLPIWAGLPRLRARGGTDGEAEIKRPAAQGRALSHQAKLLLLVHGLFAAGNALSGTFVNVYLWKAKSDYGLIGWFAVAQQVTMALTFWLAGKWVKEYNKMLALRFGVGVNAVFYVLVLALGVRAVQYVWLLGAVQGLAAGLFWLSFNVVYFEVTGPKDRDRFNGYAGLLMSLSGMAAPWISGFLITHTSQANGYRIIFSISLGVFVTGVLVSFFLKKRKMSGYYEWTYGFRHLKVKRGPWRSLFPAMVAQGVREGVFAFMIALLVYVSTRNEMKLGNFSLVTSTVGLVSFYLAGRLLKPAFRRSGMLVGAIAIIAVILPFFWRMNYGTLLLFGVGTAMFIPLYTVPITSVAFDIIGRDSESAKHRVEYVVLRELGLNIGRLFGTLLFITVVAYTVSPLAINVLLLVIGSSPLFAWLLIRRWLSPAAMQKG